MAEVAKPLDGKNRTIVDIFRDFITGNTQPADKTLGNHPNRDNNIRPTAIDPKINSNTLLPTPVPLYSTPVVGAPLGLDANLTGRDLHKEIAKKLSIVAREEARVQAREQAKFTADDTTKRLTASPAGTSVGSINNNTDAQQSQAAGQTSTPKTTILSTNVLNNYSSYNYVFTLSGLSSKSLIDPTETNFNNDSKKLQILSSAGKGKDYKIDISEDVIITDSQTKDIVTGFNEKSSGRYDLYIDNVEIDTIMTFSPGSGPTLPTAFRFEVFEPYSMSGFFDAMQATALASGYLNYAEASFLLKMKFIGYNGDTDEIEKDIKGSTRYFGLKITKVQLEVTEKGTKYTCVGIPFNEYGFSDEINKLSQNIKVQGVNIQNILTNLADSIQIQRTAIDKEAYKGNPPGADTYEIDVSAITKLSNSVLSEHAKENKIFNFTDPQAATTRNAYGGSDNKINKTSVSNDPTSSVINFSMNTNITDCIAAIITESKWARGIVRDVEKLRDPSSGLLDYFILNLEVKNDTIINPIKNRPYQKFKYIIKSYKIHYTLIPDYQQEKFKYTTDMEDKMIFRKYNYIYTGRNVDILDFKINFNNSYMAPAVIALGRDPGGSTMSNTPSNEAISSKVISESKVKTALNKKQSGIATPGSTLATWLTTYHANQLNSRTVSANQPLLDPYYLQSKAMYEAIINNPADMVKVDLGIIGDPIYLSDTGVSNFNIMSTSKLADNGSINQNHGVPLIKIIFRNPEDIGPDGIMRFDNDRIQFGGVYLIKKVTSKFSSGVFTQKLVLNRMPQDDQIILTATKPLESSFESKPLTSAGLADASAL